MGELEATLKWFKHDKSPGPDGWPVKFCMAFLDTLGEDLLKIIEDYRINGRCMKHSILLSSPSSLNQSRCEQ